MSRQDGKALWGFCWLGLLSVFTLACASKQKGEAGPAPNPQPPSPAVSSAPADYPQVFCQNLPKLKIKPVPNLEASITYFCKSGNATDKLRSLIQAATAAPDDPKEQTKIYVEKSIDTPVGWSEFIYLWAFVAPIQPVDIKNRPVVETLAKGYSSPTTEMKTTATSLGIEALDNTGFHIKSAKLDYALRITGDNGFKAEHTRTTEFNIYQVATSEMGFSEEHLIDAQNPNYKFSTMINLSIKDGRPGKTGSVVVNLLNINIFNQGSPSVAKNTAADISRYLAESLYNALK
jgi:hypothetical protein